MDGRTQSGASCRLPDCHAIVTKGRDKDEGASVAEEQPFCARCRQRRMFPQRCAILPSRSIEAMEETRERILETEQRGQRRSTKRNARRPALRASSLGRPEAGVAEPFVLFVASVASFLKSVAFDFSFARGFHE